MDDQIRAALSAGFKYFTGVVIAFLVLAAYLLITVGTIDDPVLLFGEHELYLPLIDASMRVVPFFWLAPPLMLVLHVYVLLERRRLADRICRVWPDGLPSEEAKKLFVPLFLFSGLPGRRLGHSERALLAVGFLLIALAPVVILLAFQYRYLPVRDPLANTWHKIVVTVDLALVWWLVTQTHRARRCHRKQPYGRLTPSEVVIRLVTAALAVVLSVVVLWTAWGYLALASISEEVDRPRPSQRMFLRGWKPDEAPNLADATLQFAVLTDARLPGADLSGADLRRAKLMNADLRGVTLKGARLADADLSGADLTGADLSGADLRTARLDGTRLPGAHLAEALMQRIEGRNVDLFAADLRRARLTGAVLPGADLRLANLEGTWLQAAHLVQAALDGTILPPEAAGLDLRGASLSRARGIQLRLVDVRWAEIGEFDLCAYEIRRTDLRGVRLGSAPSSVPAESVEEERDEEWGDPHRRGRTEGTRISVPERVEQLVTAIRGEDGLSRSGFRRRVENAWRRWESIGSVPAMSCTAATDLILLEVAIGRDHFAKLVRRAGLDDPASIRQVLALTPTLERNALYDLMAEKLVPRGCTDPYLADALLSRAAGAYKPYDPRLEANLVERLVALREDPGCGEVSEASADRWEGLRSRWCEEPQAAWWPRLPAATGARLCDGR